MRAVRDGTIGLVVALQGLHRSKDFGSHSRDWTETQHALCAFVDECRAMQLPPEKVIVEVKALAGDVGLSAGSGSKEERLLAQVVHWCILRYYDNPLDAPVFV